MFRAHTQAGFALRAIVLAVVFVGALGVAAIPVVNQEIRAQKKEEIVRILATITMAKTQYAVDHDLIDGRTVTIEQIMTAARTDKTKFLPSAPVFPLQGKLTLNPIGQLPTYTLDSGEEIKMMTPTGDAEPLTAPE